MKNNHRLQAWFIFIFLGLVWGSSFILIKKSLLAFTPTQVALARVFLTSVAFTPVVAYKLRSIQYRDLLSFSIVALAGNALPAFLYALAETHIESAVAGLLNTLTPIFTLLIGLWFFKHRSVPITQKIGVLIGFLGAAMIILYTTSKEIHLSLWSLLIVLATALYGLSGNVVETQLKGRYSPISIAGIPFVFMLLPSAWALWKTGILSTLTTHPDANVSIWALLTLSIIGTFLASTLFFKMLEISDAVFASSVSYLLPVVAIFWGVLDHEHLSVWHFLALFFIISGVYLIKRGSAGMHDFKE